MVSKKRRLLYINELSRSRDDCQINTRNTGFWTHQVAPTGQVDQGGYSSTTKQAIAEK